MQIQGSIALDAPIERAWERLSDLPSHVDWMADAESIRFTTTETRGLGTAFECVTKVGPLKTVDKMTIVEWVEGRVIAVQHTGLVVGIGRFELEPTTTGSRMVWTEVLRFPGYLGGPVTALAARPVLKRIWMGNLRRFASLL